MIKILRAVGLCTVQDLGSHGRMHEAVPPGGALVPDLLVRANRIAQNADDARAIEVMGTLTLRSDSDLVTSRGVVRANETIEVKSSAYRAEYLAVRGGIRNPCTLVCLGSALRSGDELEVSAELTVKNELLPEFALREIRILPGPDRDAFADDALDALTYGPYRTLPASDRVGTRLTGPIVPRRAGVSEQSRPMVCGAIEVPADGMPIVLGPEHPTTGGYPLIAIIVYEDRGPFFAVPLGKMVRFVSSK